MDSPRPGRLGLPQPRASGPRPSGQRARRNSLEINEGEGVVHALQSEEGGGECGVVNALQSEEGGAVNTCSNLPPCNHL